ncbi:hypothetical protein B296_00052113 [Ensete ventricosum]|uniref:Amino acid transporter transmembrane domain-containing protein n=1 Tax=Ensete ventricosum TaxID=4639 RepID=A0A426X8D8_ENSVE|nr:hypothetical protein B296_00052113 [Ensete ventricosum]
MVCTILASAWTWLVRPRKASAMTMSGTGFDAGEGNPGSVIILQKRLGVGTAAATSSVDRGWSGSTWRSVPESMNGRSGDMGPPSSAKNDRGESGACLMSSDSELSSGGRLLEWWSPGEEGALQFGSTADSCKKVGLGAFIVGVVDRSYLITLLLLWLTMLSYSFTMLAVLAMRRLQVGGADLTCVRSAVRLLAPPHTSVRPVARVGSASSAGQLSEGVLRVAIGPRDGRGTPTPARRRPTWHTLCHYTSLVTLFPVGVAAPTWHTCIDRYLHVPHRSPLPFCLYPFRHDQEKRRRRGNAGFRCGFPSNLTIIYRFGAVKLRELVVVT